MRGLGSITLHAILLWYINSSIGSLASAVWNRNETDRLALLAFKDAITQESLGVMNSWNHSIHYCDWPGVSCSRLHRQRVSVLDLGSQGLSGTLSPHIGNLSFLRIIFLQNNTFHGKIPPEIGRLFRLRLLYLHNNSFSGELPINLTLCSSLRELNLMNNMLTGKIPGEFYLPRIDALGLSQNNFIGNIPPSFGNLSSLYYLSLSNTLLEGRIPGDLSRISGLQYLLLSLNKLSGTIPSSLYNLSSIIVFAVIGNQLLQGSLPINIGLSLPNLQQLYLGGNQFTGPIPVSLSNASQLEHLSIISNKFSGSVPWELGRLQNLSWIGFSFNMLGTAQGNDWSFINSITNCSKLERLLLGGNHLRGSLPNSIANLSTRIIYLSIGVNQIYGTIPPGIENLVNLQLLDIQYVFLTGSIPSGIGKLQRLLRLYLSGNTLTGQIPSSLGNLTVLYDLALKENHLAGKIPPSLGNCRQLQVMDLSQNLLNDTIPSMILGLPSLISINLSHNSLSGSLPFEVGNLKQLEKLDVSNNRLSGGIPNTLGNCLSLDQIHLECNFLEGSIPQDLSSLRGVQYLDLSRNNLSGQIPEYLSKFPLLKNLNLSFNELEGEVPKVGVFGNASLISIVRNKKLCGGISGLKLPKCLIQDSKEKGMSPVLKALIPVFASILCLIILACFLVMGYRRRRISRKKDSSTPLFEHDQYLRISYAELLKATNGFSEANLIGVGSYGSVYKGVLEQDEKVVAVKVLNLGQRGASKSFISECKALKNIRHRNLLKILSVCSSSDFQGNDFKALVYEYMPQGSLEKWLHPKEEDGGGGEGEPELKNLNLIRRLNIAIDIASAMEYLHYHCQATIVHSDLKPNNVLLDDDMTAHVGDFGLAKVISCSISSNAGQNQSSSVLIKGSIGYVAPEYGMGGEVSAKGDVYSYGILLLEMFTGKRPMDEMFKEGLNLHNSVQMALTEQVMEAVDPLLLSEPEKGTRGRMEECLVLVLQIGIACSVESPRDRMEMGDVLTELQTVRDVYQGVGVHGARRSRSQIAGEGPSNSILKA